MTRSINGTGWAVMADQESVQKAVDYFNTGEVFILGSASSILTTQHIVGLLPRQQACIRVI